MAYGRRQDHHRVKLDVVSSCGVSIKEPSKSGLTLEGLKGAYIRCMLGRQQSIRGEVACVRC
jgi:hypothetical protein